MIADRIKQLREQNNYTQTYIAKSLGVTRSCVNAWEMGISVPSTQYIVELAQFFHVSTDFLLGVNSTVTVSVSGLDDADIALVQNLVNHLKNLKKI